jgi:hypothetical protein
MYFQVFQCKHQKCGHFYHPNCVAKLLNPDSKTRAVLHGQHIAGGLEFECPMHQCKLCKEAENKDYKEMQFAVCRRCPTAYHRKCLPRFAFAMEIGDGYALAILHPVSFWLRFIGVNNILFLTANCFAVIFRSKSLTKRVFRGGRGRKFYTNKF